MGAVGRGEVAREGAQRRSGHRCNESRSEDSVTKPSPLSLWVSPRPRRGPVCRFKSLWLGVDVKRKEGRRSATN